MLLLLWAMPCLMQALSQTMILMQLSLTVPSQLLMPSQQPTPYGLLMSACSCPSLAPATAQQLQHRQHLQQALQALQVCLSSTWATGSLLAP
jgi:hypothetical protein